jgi:hypothetical protein
MCTHCANVYHPKCAGLLGIRSHLAPN